MGPPSGVSGRAGQLGKNILTSAIPLFKNGYSRFCTSVLLVTNVDHIAQILHLKKIWIETLVYIPLGA